MTHVNHIKFALTRVSSFLNKGWRQVGIKVVSEHSSSVVAAARHQSE